MIRTFKKIFGLLDKGDKKLLPFIVIMVIIEALFEMLGVSLVVPFIALVIDKNIINNNQYIKSFCAILNINDYEILVVLCIVALIFVYIIKNAFMLIECSSRYNFICNSRHKVQKQIFNSILDRPYEYFININSSEIIREVSDDCNKTFEVLGSLLDVLANLFLAIGIIVIIFIIEPIMTVVVIIMVSILSFFLIFVVKPVIREHGKKLIKYATLNYKNVLETVQGIKIIKVTHSKGYFFDEFKINGEKVIEADRKNIVVNRIPHVLTETVCVITILIYILVLFMNGVDLKNLVPILGAFIFSSLKLIPSANKIINSYTSIAFNEEPINNVVKNYEQSKLNCVKIPIEKIDLKNSIELIDITYKYPNTERKILDKACLTIPVGKSVGIIGHSGIGKTTAIDIILGLLAKNEGCIKFDGKILDTCIDNYPINIGYVPQYIYIRDDTVASNIAFGVKKDDINYEKIIECIRASKLNNFVSSLDNGIYTSIGENGVKISGGERQRLGIARALYNNPDLLVFDEATSSLDLETEAGVLQSIEDLQGKKTILIIAHRPQAIKWCDYIYRIVDGKFINEK